MMNMLDEQADFLSDIERDVHVINKQILVKIGFGTVIFEFFIWIFGFVFALAFDYLNQVPEPKAAIIFAIGILPGVIFAFMKMSALSRLRQLEQRIQANASQIDNYLEQRVIILKNLVGLLAKSIELDKNIMKTVAAYRAGVSFSSDGERNRAVKEIDKSFSHIGLCVESYPELKSQGIILEAMGQNSYLQQEITASRNLYNDTILLWNQTIFQWPISQIVAARASYTTRIPFIASSGIKKEAREVFF